jgi:hypothetical protein
MQEEEIFAVPRNAKFGSAARGSNRFTFRDSFALLDPDVVDMYFQDDAEKPNENSIFGTSITDDDLEELKLDSSMDLDDDFLDLTNSSSQSTSSASPPDSQLISFDSSSSSTAETSETHTEHSFAPPATPESAVGVDSGDVNSSNLPGEVKRNVSQELQQASESFVRPRRRTHYASMISSDDLKSLSAQSASSILISSLLFHHMLHFCPTIGTNLSTARSSQTKTNLGFKVFFWVTFCIGVA